MIKRTKQLLEDFLNNGGNVPPKPGGQLKGFLRDFLIEEADYTCQLCGFKKQNEFSKRWIIEIDHKDGNWKNNTRENLRVVCPNCSAGTSNYKAMNSGNGRQYTPTRRKV